MGTPPENILNPLTYSPCNVCPRGCGSDRTAAGPGAAKKTAGFCGETADIRAAAALLHYGEEPPLTRSGGSGTVFFTGCTLRCSFCQNRQISRAGMGRRTSTVELAEIFLRLQTAGAENINLVTGTHFIPGIIEAWRTARARGLVLPVVWNTSGYETAEAVDALAEMIDIFLPDVKSVDTETAGALFGTHGYAEAVRSAVERMVRVKPLLRGEAPESAAEQENNSALISGTIVRHLVLPGRLKNTRRVLEWYARTCLGKTLLSVMFQYVPLGGPGGRADPCGRGVSAGEYGRVMGMLDEFGIEEGFVQELDDDVSWLPDFGNPRSFPSSESRIVWHWKTGFARPF